MMKWERQRKCAYDAANFFWVEEIHCHAVFKLLASLTKIDIVCSSFFLSSFFLFCLFFGCIHLIFTTVFFFLPGFVGREIRHKCAV